MTSAIGAASAVTAPIPTAAPAAAAPPGAATAQRAAQPAAAAAPQGQQQAALNQLLAKYKYGQSHGVAAAALSSLGRQILSEAKTLNLHVTLPRAPAGGNAPATTSPATTSRATASPATTSPTTASPNNGKVDVRA